MISLVITTSFGKLSLALYRGEELLYQHGPVKLFQADIAKVTEEAFAATEITPGQLNRLIVDVGPGGTSSVRTGVAFANALSYGLKIPVFAVSSLEALCFQVGGNEEERSRALGLANSLGDTMYFGFHSDEGFTVKHGDSGLLKEEITAHNLTTVCGDPSVVKKLSAADLSLHPSEVSVVSPAALLAVATTKGRDQHTFPDLPIPLAELMDV